MAKWRSLAISVFPEHQKVIEGADSISSWWLELHLLFESACRASVPDENFIARTYSFADLCMAAPRGQDARHDPVTSVYCYFYEHLPQLEQSRADMPKWFRVDELLALRTVFSYHIGDAKFCALLAYVRANRHRYVVRDRDSRLEAP